METLNNELKCPKCGYSELTYMYRFDDDLIECVCMRCQFVWNVFPIDRTKNENP